MIPKKNRLNRSRVHYTLKKGSRLSSEHFNIKYLSTRSKVNRFCVSVSLKVSNKATIRNRLRRQIYNIINNLEIELPEGLNIVVMAKQSALKLNHPQLQQQLIKILKKIHG